MSYSHYKIPEHGIDPDALLNELDQSKGQDVDWASGRTWSLVYHLDDRHRELVGNAYKKFLSENYLNPFAFQSVRRMERSIIAMASDLFNGDDTTTGTFTSGGTESIFLALYTYREWAHSNKKVKGKPEVVVPSSIHPAFDKAAHILGMKLTRIPVGKDFAADFSAIEKAIGKNTILLCASAPSYPHGILDPIDKIAAIARRANLPLHIDACIGGFMLPWVEALGYKVEPWDFRQAGVTSISADIHKFGYAAKGASLILYRSEQFFKHQIYIQANWSGGIYASPTMLGSRSAGPIAAAWTAMLSLGRKGYQEIAESIMKARTKLRDSINAVPELEIIGDPVMNIISYQSVQKGLDVYVVADYLEEKGWVIDRQQFPPSIHMTVMSYNIPVIDKYLSDLHDAVKHAKDNRRASGSGQAAMYGTMARVPMRGVVEKNVRNVILGLYTEQETETTAQPPQPNWMGFVNRVLRFMGR